MRNSSTKAAHASCQLPSWLRCMPSLAKADGTASIGSAAGLVSCNQGGSGFSQLDLSRHLSVPEQASGCPTLQPDSADQPLELALAAATAGLVSTKRQALSRPAPARTSPPGERTPPREEAEMNAALAGLSALAAARCPSVLAGWAAAAATAQLAAHAYVKTGPVRSASPDTSAKWPRLTEAAVWPGPGGACQSWRTSIGQSLWAACGRLFPHRRGRAATAAEHWRLANAEAAQ